MRKTSMAWGWVVMATIVLTMMACQPSKHSGTPDLVTLSLIQGSDKALIDQDHPGSKGIPNGYEGGTVFLHEDVFHMFVTEEITHWTGTRTGHWTSIDGVSWKREGTLQESSKDPENARHAIWSPMPVYNKHSGRWNLFYVGYMRSGTENGQVFRAESEVAGYGGVAGPYRDLPGTVMSFGDAHKNDWEGSQGTDSFYPFQVGGKWVAFYGSSDAASRWDVGLATADSLEGPWTRVEGPPVFSRAENPIVTRMRDGLYLAVYDDLTELSGNNRIGYAWSKDGLHWSHSYLAIPMPVWTRNVRTPQSLVPAGKGKYWIYITGQAKGNFDRIGRILVRVKS